MSSVLHRYRSPWTRTIDIGTELRALGAWWTRPERIVRGLRAVHDFLGGAPASCAYAFTLFVTWWTLRGISDIAGHRLILSLSTNLHNMRRDPLQVLVASAFWTDGGLPWVGILGFLTVMAFAERWLGTLRWILVFATGHVGATLIVVTGISYAVHHRLIPVKVAVAPDVGSSYGSSAVLAALAFHLRGTPRLLWIGGLVGWYLFGVWRGRTFTDYGHLTAIVIGLLVGAIAVLASRRLERVRDRTSAPAAKVSATTPAAGAARPHERPAPAPDSAPRGNELPPALQQPHGGLDQARGNRA
ncbi:rhomboid-like protein [Nocardia terpenica]|uniref:rhomboid-like protein n=1 Tax=Nocardia terpenica TaxID=455432 RepID=UPI0018E09FD0|nr:rhomboid-like protein [Nocardia terpenica]